MRQDLWQQRGRGNGIQGRGLCGTALDNAPRQGGFRRAIAQSGGAHQAIFAATARKIGRRFAEKLGVAATREAIAAVPVERFLQAQAELKADLVAHPDPERWGFGFARGGDPGWPQVRPRPPSHDALRYGLGGG